nr:MAG TPA_asm: head closure knob [Caudoviricetes sp.]
MPGATKWRRLRAKKVKDRYSGKLTGEDWKHPDVLEFAGSLASSSSMRTPDALREETTSTAYLTSADPSLDIMSGDRIRAMPDDGRCWEVSGYPSRDRNAFTSWRPTIEIPLSEYRG